MNIVSEPELKLEAESIVFLKNGPRDIFHSEGLPRLGITATMILFKPTAETLEKIRTFQRGNTFHSTILVDKWDDGLEDIHASSCPLQFLEQQHHGLKAHTIILRFVAF